MQKQTVEFLNLTTRGGYMWRRFLPIVVIIFVSNVVYGEKEFGGQPKYERKSISYVNLLLVTNQALRITPKETNYILNEIKKKIELERFDYNPLPQSVVNKLSRAIQAKGSVSLDELQNLIEQIVAPPIVKMLEVVAEVRAKEFVSEAARASFIATKAKEIGVTAEDIEKALNAAYIYVPALLNYKIFTKTDKKGNKLLICTIDAAIIWYHIVYGKPPRIELLKVTKTHSEGVVDPTKKNLRWRHKRVTPREFAYYSAVSNAARNLQRQMRDLAPFKLGAPIIEVYRNAVSFELGTKEGVKLDWGFKVYEQVLNAQGKLVERYVGYVKVRKVGNNKKIPPEFSRAQPIIGSGFDKGMLVREFPRLGTDVLFRTLYMPVSGKFGLEGSGSFCVSLSCQYDLAPLFGIPIFSETWTNLELIMGMSLVKVTGWGDNQTSRFSGIELGLIKKFYFNRIALVFDGEIGFSVLSIENEDTDDETSFGALGMSFIGGVELAVLPELNFGLRGGLRMYGTDIDDYGREVSFSGPTFGAYLVYSPPTLPFDPWTMIQGLTGLTF